ncbi:MAG: polysaccharide biosynthesis tyrosine autokinase [Bacteroidales bacterium]|nr:polysaccharide biosynthesis tyrosine autokinase [Bacteroidales bacterium]
MEQTPQLVDKEDNDNIFRDVKLCLAQLLTNWKWFLLSVTVCMVLGWFYWQSKPRVFLRQSVMLIEDASDNSMGFGSSRSRRSSNMNTLLELQGVSVGDNLKNEIFILSSKRLMQRVVEKLKLDVDMTTSEGLHDIALYGYERPVDVVFKDAKAKRSSQFVVKKVDDNTCRITDYVDDKDGVFKDVTVKLGQMVQTPAGTFCLVRGKSFGAWDDQKLTVTRLTVSKAASRFMGEMTIDEYDKETSLIVISCNDIHVKRADDILNELFETYKQDVVENKDRVALNTARFIDERIVLIGKELGDVESQLAGFKQQNGLIDLKETARSVLTETTTARQASLTAETQLNVAKYLNDYLADHSNDRDLIPALNIGTTSFNTQVAEYNRLLNDRNRMAGNSSEEQTLIRELDRELKQMRAAIAASAKSVVKTLEMELRDAQANEQMLMGRVTGAPQQEKIGLNIQRQQTLKEALYTYLLNKREEVALQQAINEANVRIVEGPIGEKKVSPRGSIIMLVAFIVGLLIPAAILWIMFQMDVTIHGRREVEDTTSVPVLGEIPLLKKADATTLISDQASNAPIVEAFRILRYSMGFMQHSTQVLLCTSTTPGQGKSFISRNLAIVMAMAGKKVLLIDADVRKRNLSQTFGGKHGLTTFLADEYSKVEDIIRPAAIAQQVDFIPAGPIPPNPSELLMSKRFDDLVTQLRNQYDSIIIDTTPMYSVADANIVGRVADTTIFVLRVGMQNRDFLPELERIYKEKRYKNLCVVLNDADFKMRRYGYGNGYGYGYGYGQQKAEKGWFNSLIEKLRS